MQKANEIEKKLINIAEEINIDKNFRLELRTKFLNRGDSLNSKSSTDYISLFFNKISMKQSTILFGVGSMVFVAGMVGVFALGAIPFVNTSKPGDFLYAVDKSFEYLQVQAAYLGGEKVVAETHIGLAQERVAEINALISPSAFAIVRVVYAQDETETEVTVDDENQEALETLVNDYEVSLDKAEEALDLLKGREPSSEQTEELANTLLEAGEDLENTLVTIRGKVDGDTSFIIDNAVNLTVDFQGETFTVLYFDLEKGNGEENQALPEAKVENRVDKAKRELARIDSLISKSEGKISEDALTQAKVLYAAAMEAVERGETSFNSGDLEEAYREVDLAYELARQVKTYLRETAKDEKKAEREAEKEIKRAEKELEKAKKQGVDTTEDEQLIEEAKKAHKNKDFKKTKELSGKVKVKTKEKEVKKYKEQKQKSNNGKVKGKENKN